MKVIKLSAAQTRSLENLGVDIGADVLLPFDKGPGEFSVCEDCVFILHIISKGDVVKGCKMKVGDRPVVCSSLHLKLY